MENILVLEIVDDEIKILELCTTQKVGELFPIRLNRIALPRACVREGLIIEPKLVSDAIVAFIKENNIYTKKAIVLINLPFVFSRIIRLPQNLSDAQIRLNLEAEINQYQTFAGKETILDFKKIEEINEEGIKKVNVLYVTTLRALTAAYLKTMELAGLDLIGVEAPIFSVMRLLDEVDLKPASGEVTLLILIGKKYLDMCILKGSRPRFLHSIEIEPYDVEKNKPDFIDRLVSAIRLVVSFYQARLIHGEQISRIIIHPLDASLNSIHTQMQEKLPQIPIQASNPLTKIFIEKEKPQESEELKFSLSCLMGAALRIENKDRPFDLNLFWEQKKSRQYHLNQIYLLFISLAFVLIIMIISFGWIFLTINILQGKISHLAKELKAPSSQLYQALDVKEKKDTLLKQFDEALSLTRTAKKYFYFKNMAKAGMSAPAGLWLTDIALEQANEYLMITGEAKTEKPIFDYISKLSDSRYFALAELVSSKAEAGILRFMIRCVIK